MTSAGTSGKKKRTTRPGAPKKRRAPIQPSRKPAKKPAAVSKAASPEKRRFLSPPLLTVWILAVVVLAGLIYLGRSSPREPAPTADEHTVSPRPEKEQPPRTPSARQGPPAPSPQPRTPAASNSVPAKGTAGREAKETARSVQPTAAPPVLPAQPQTPAASNSVPAKGTAGREAKETARNVPPTAAPPVLPAQPQTPAASNSVPAKGTAGRETKETARNVPPTAAPPVLPAQPQTPAVSNGASGRGILGPPPKIVSRDIPAVEPVPAPAAPSQTPVPAPPDRTPQKLASLPRPPSLPPPAPPAAPPAPMARVAIVIDDLGQDIEMVKKFMAVPLPLTFALLPHQSHTREIAELARSHHHEVLLHLPMEPHGYPGVNPGAGALLLSMTSGDLLRNLRANLDSVPNTSGVNNHMGSRFTEDAGAMKIVLAELNRRGLYFIDSATSPASSARAAASQVGIPFRRRDVFLDHNPSEGSIRLQLNRLILKARVEGTALAIGHPYGSTLKALSGAARQFQQGQVVAVPARDLVVDESLVTHRQ